MIIFYKYILEEYYNCFPTIQKFESNKEITFEKIINYYNNNTDFDPDKDSITLIEDPSLTKTIQL